MTSEVLPTAFVTGATGLLGRSVVERLKSSYRIYALARTPGPASIGVHHLPLDLTDADALERVLGAYQPGYVFHSAALASIEECQRYPDLAARINVEVPRYLASWSAAHGARLIHISTDAVFDGKSGPYEEHHAPAPQTVYGQTKLEGEQVVLQEHPDALVARVNFFGWSATGTRSLAEFFLTELASGRSVRGFRDIKFASLYTRDLIDLIVEADVLSLSGVRHFASSDSMSKMDFGRLIATKFGYDPELILPSDSTDRYDLVTRTKNLTMSPKKLARDLDRPMPTFEQGVQRMLEDAKSTFFTDLRAAPNHSARR